MSSLKCDSKAVWWHFRGGRGEALKSSGTIVLHVSAKKEFTMTSRTGFGIDGDDEIKNADFAQVRGEFDDNPFVQEVQQHIRIKTELGNELIGRIANIS